MFVLGMKRSQREGWLRDPEARAANARLTSQRQSEIASYRLTMSADCPQINPATAMAGELAQLNGKTRLGFARAQAAVAEHVEGRSGQENLRDAQNIKASAQTANLVFGWDKQGAAPRIRLELLANKGEVVAIEFEAEVCGNDWEEW